MVKTSSSELHKAAWNEDGDAKMAAAFASKQRGTGNWTTSSKRSGQRRSGKNCRERWGNNQKPADPKLKSFTPQEEELIIQLHAVLGSRWPIIAQQLPEKTESDVKILWNSKLKKKLSAMGIDPVTHKPFSQILADYGSMGAFRLHPLSRDLKGALPAAAGPVKAELSDPQLDAEEASASSFSWSDFFLEEAFAAQQNGGHFDDDEILQGKGDTKIDGAAGFDAAPSSSSAFVEAMIGKQDEMCSQLPCFYEEPFYY
ncbi:transcription factor MYB35-like [Salvia miltiorrhiza]|uniref:MYB-related transcription factor n=1 Tax=Salvia miltiorrhiza TaxID=226208 RepID=A0A059PRW9_SALMI|nr:transcription factor MYB35-like [Salvia miltiorrhiza]AGN52119.1 MYB-related transcription factor [Salvia miltiorrhiza]AGN52229.1 MYB-related transcription factor [Salvia miltiorrhiza]